MAELGRKQIVGIAVAVFALALLLRLIGIGWGLKNDYHNQTYHPDEAVIFSYSQDIEPAALKFTPGFYNYGTLYLTMLRIAGDMTAAYTGAPDPKSDDSFWSFASRVHFAGRLLSAIAGAATAVVLFFVGLRFLGLFGGLAAALAIAVSSAHSVHSRFQTVDIIATFFLALAALYSLKLLDEEIKNPLKVAALAGLFAGLSAGTKYTGILSLLTLLVVVFALSRKQSLPASEAAKLFGTGLLTAVIVFVVTTPGVLLDTEKFMRDFNYEMVHTATGHGLVFAETSPAFIYHLGNIFSGIGLLIGGLGIAGLIFAAVKKHWWALALLAFFLPYYLLIGRAEVKFLRYTFPLYVGIAAGFGYVMAETQRNEKWRKAGVVFGILAIGGIDSGGLVGAGKSTAWMASEDPRDSAAKILRQEAAKAPTTVGYSKDPWTWSVPVFKDAPLPRKPMGPAYIGKIVDISERHQVPPGYPNVFFLARMSLMQAAENPKPVLYYEPATADANTVPPQDVRYADFDARLITEARPDFITLTSLESGHLERLREAKSSNPEVQAAVAQYETFRIELEKSYSIVAMFGAPAPSVEDMQYIQPQVLVWKRKSGS